jgi:hypothetical protein
LHRAAGDRDEQIPILDFAKVAGDRLRHPLKRFATTTAMANPNSHTGTIFVAMANFVLEYLKQQAQNEL